MTGIELMKAERGVYYAVLQILTGEGVPRDMWPLVVDSAAGRIKDEAMTYVAMAAHDAMAKASKTEDKEGGDGEHPAGD